jgi:Xaa-Pro aminopeptidase
VPGMVLTVEPGLYVPADDPAAPEALRGVGIRIEDDVLVTAGGHQNLTEGTPKAADEVEACCVR